MAKILTGERLKHWAAHLEELDKSGTQGIYFCFDSKDTGKTAYLHCQALWPNHDSGYGIDKRDFFFYFAKDKRNEIYTELVKEVEDYRQAHPEVTNPYSDDPGGGTTTTTTGSGSDVPKKSSTDWVTYIIIGVAAVVILMLLLDKKKK